MQFSKEIGYTRIVTWMLTTYSTYALRVIFLIQYVWKSNWSSMISTKCYKGKDKRTHDLPLPNPLEQNFLWKNKNKHTTNHTHPVYFVELLKRVSEHSQPLVRCPETLLEPHALHLVHGLQRRQSFLRWWHHVNTPWPHPLKLSTLMRNVLVWTVLLSQWLFPPD